MSQFFILCVVVFDFFKGGLSVWIWRFMHRCGNIFFLCFSFCIFCTRGKEPNVTKTIPISRHGLNKGNAIYLYVSEKRCVCNVVYHFLDNQLKQVKSSSLAIRTHAKSFHHNVFVSNHRLYSHLYFYIGFYSWNIVVFKVKEPPFGMTDAVVNEEWYCLNLYNAYYCWT